MNSTRKPTEQVLGSELQVGDVIRNLGYRWTITAVALDDLGRYAAERREAAASGTPTTRYCVTADACEGENAPTGYARGMTMGLRSDLHWTRELAA